MDMKHRKNRTRIFVLALMSLFVLLAAACGSGTTTAPATQPPPVTDTGGATEPDGTESAPAPGGDVKLSLVNWEGDQMNAAVKEALAAFSKESGIEVELQAAPLGDYKTSLNSMIMAGEAPDLYQSGHDWALSFFAEGLNYDWSDYVQKDEAFVKGFYPGSTELWRDPNGKQVGFPNFVNVYGIWYNEDLLKAAGLEAPKDGWTYEDLFTMAEALADPATGKFGLYGLDLSAFSLAVMSVANGGEGFVDDFAFPTKVQADEEFTKIVTRVRELIAAKVLPATSYEVENIQSQFTDGNVALLSYGQWLISDLINNKPNFAFGLAPNPQGSAGKQVSIFDPVGWCSPKDIAHPDETWELLKFSCSTMYSTVLPVTPVAACAFEADSEAFFKTVTDAGQPETADAVKTMMSAETYMPVRFLTTWASDGLKFWNPAYNAILDGEADIDKLPDAIDQLNDFIGKQN